MANAIWIVQPNQVRDFLGLSRQSPEWNQFIEGDTDYFGCIDIASRACEDYIGNKVAVQEIQNLIVDGYGSYCLKLPYSPIVRVSGLTETPNTPDKSKLQYRFSVASGWQDVFTTQSDMDNYLFVDPQEPWKLQILEGIAGFPCGGKQNIRISYFAGYEVIPGAIVTACLEMCLDLKNQFAITAENNTTAIGEKRLGLSSRGDGGQTQSFLQMSDRWAKMLSKYRKLVP